MRGGVVPGTPDSRLHNDGAGPAVPVLAKLTGDQGLKDGPVLFGTPLAGESEDKATNGTVHLVGRFVLEPILPVSGVRSA